MKRIMTLVIGALLALSLAAPMALAQEEGRGGAPQEHPYVGISPIVVDAGTFGNCAFPISADFSGNTKDLQLPGGRFISTSPHLTVTLTNLDNDNKETFSITGAFHQTTMENGDVRTVSTGRSLLGDPEAGLVIVSGNFSYVFDTQGNLVQPLSGEGQMIDVCAQLA